MCTVSSSWYKPSKVAWLHYGRKNWAEYATRRFDKKLRGRQVSTKIVPPPPFHGRHKAIWSVELGNLDVNTTEADIKLLLNGIPPDKIIFGKSSSRLSEEEACQFVKTLLRRGGPIHSFETSTGPTSARIKAFARFDSLADMHAVNALSGQFFPDLGSKIVVTRIVAVKIPVLNELYQVTAHDIQALQQTDQDSVRIAVMPFQQYKPVIIRIYGEDPRSVAKKKASLEELLAGEVLLGESQSVLWDDYFMSPEGFTFLRNLSQAGRLFVYRDTKKRQITLHGCPDLFEATRHSILAKVIEQSHLSHCIELDKALLGNALHGAFRRLVMLFGKHKARLDISKKPPVIVIQGSRQEYQHALAILEDNAVPAVDNASSDGPTQECPACMIEAENPLELSCGHFYCQDCFERQCEVADGAQIPLRCFGHSGECGKIISLQDLQHALPHETFESLLLRSLDSYVRTHSQELRYCPTPDCPSVYRPSTDGHPITCSSCLTSICTSCHTTAHDGLTCDDSTYLGSESYQAFKKWKEENNVKDCPKCQAPIEKSFGCNHMTCTRCGIHICWFCLHTFSTGEECYDHMGKSHSSIYDGPEAF